jgi:hypothetical protein
MNKYDKAIKKMNKQFKKSGIKFQNPTEFFKELENYKLVIINRR